MLRHHNIVELDTLCALSDYCAMPAPKNGTAITTNKYLTWSARIKLPNDNELHFHTSNPIVFVSSACVCKSNRAEEPTQPH
jgi:hypothetical protein